MKIELIVFDLDGTLTSSHETIYKSTVYTLNKLNIPGELPHDKFCKRIGLHFEDIFNEFEIPVKNYEEFIKLYKSMYFEFIDSSEVYLGVRDTLKELKSQKIKTALLTTKTQDQADKIINYFGLDCDLDYIMGRRPGLAHKPSPEPLLKICEDFKIEPGNCMIVGDSEMDIQCGKSANAKTCGVTYGYRSRADLENELPDFLIDNIGDLTPIVENFN